MCHFLGDSRGLGASIPSSTVCTVRLEASNDDLRPESTREVALPAQHAWTERARNVMMTRRSRREMMMVVSLVMVRRRRKRRRKSKIMILMMTGR
jgi:hypothetical protein